MNFWLNEASGTFFHRKQAMYLLAKRLWRTGQHDAFQEAWAAAKHYDELARRILLWLEY